MPARFRPTDSEDIFLGQHGRFDLFTDQFKSYLILKFSNDTNEEIAEAIMLRDGWEGLLGRIRDRRPPEDLVALKACWDLLKGPRDPSVSPRSR